MKKHLLLLLLFVGLSTLCQAQHPVIQKFYDKYQDMDGFDDITINSWLLQMAINASYEHSGKKIKSHISHLRILHSENGNPVDKQDFLQLIKKLKRDNFEDFMSIHSDGNRVNFYLKEKGNSVTNILMTVHGKDGFFLLSLEGLIRLKDLKNLDIEFDGSDHLKKLPERA